MSPLTLLIYNLQRVLANNTRNNQNIKGVKIGNIEIKQTLYEMIHVSHLIADYNPFKNITS